MVEHLLKYNSDHSHVLLKVKRATHRARRKDRAFKFETTWLFDDSYEQAVREAWNDIDDGFVLHKLGSVGRKLQVRS